MAMANNHSAGHLDPEEFADLQRRLAMGDGTNPGADVVTMAHRNWGELTAARWRMPVGLRLSSVA